jgi:hypothetical protein
VYVRRNCGAEPSAPSTLSAGALDRLIQRGFTSLVASRRRADSEPVELLGHAGEFGWRDPAPLHPREVFVGRPTGDCASLSDVDRNAVVEGGASGKDRAHEEPQRPQRARPSPAKRVPSRRRPGQPHTPDPPPRNRSLRYGVESTPSSDRRRLSSRGKEPSSVTSSLTIPSRLTMVRHLRELSRFRQSATALHSGTSSAEGCLPRSRSLRGCACRSGEPSGWVVPRSSADGLYPCRNVERERSGADSGNARGGAGIHGTRP